MNGLFLNLLRTSLVVGAASLLLALLTPLWDRRYGALWKKRMWCLLAALALLGVLVHLPEGAVAEISVPERQVVVIRGAESSRISVVDPDTLPSREEIQRRLDIEPSNDAADSGTEKAVPSVSLLFVGEVVWAVGAALFTLYLAVGEALFRHRLRRWAKPVRSEELSALYGHLYADAAPARTPALLVCPGIGSPMLTGLFQPKLLLPHEDYSETEVSYILRHELTHWRSRDLCWKVLLLAANAVHWFNPTVWLLRREASREIERACDERVMAGADLAARRTYGAALLSAAQSGQKPALSTRFTGGKRAMKARLRSILEGKKRAGAALAAAAVLLTGCAVPLVSCTQKTSDTENNAEQENWQTAQLTVKEGVPYIRYSGDADWTKLGEAIAPPREWKDDHLAGRDTAKTLDFDPEVSIGLVTAQYGWLVATYGGGVAVADTYVYCTADGGKTWTETPAAPGTPWHLAATDFIDPQRAIVAGANFAGAPVFYTADGGTTWRKETLPFSAEPYWEATSFRNMSDSVALMASYGTGVIGRAVFHLSNETWETAYQVSLRDNGGTLDVLLEQGGTSSVVCTLRQGQEYQKPEDVSLTPFNGSLGRNGFRLDLYFNNFGWRQSRYYAVRDTADGGGAVQIADSFGAASADSDFSVDLDGDGIQELVCNNTYEADGVQRVRIFRSAAKGTVEAAEVGEDYLAQALGMEVRDFSSPVSSVYDPDTGKLTFQYTVGSGDGLSSHQEVLPLNPEALSYSAYQSSDTVSRLPSDAAASSNQEMESLKADQPDFTLSIPKKWDDSAVILTNSDIVWSTGDSKDTLLFELHEKLAYTKNKSGIVWGLYIFTKDAFANRFGEVDPAEIVGANSYIIGTDEGHVYLLIEPTDVQYLENDKQSQTQYELLQKESQTVLADFLTSNQITMNTKCPDSPCYRVNS